VLLAIDIGNSETTWGVFDGDDLRARFRTSSTTARTADEYRLLLEGFLSVFKLGTDEIDSVSLCSVVPPLTGIFKSFLGQYSFHILVVGAGIKTGIRIRFDNPREIGSDRITDAVAAHNLYGGDLIIVDMGTATTFDVVSREAEYLGGAIAPGLIGAMESLFRNTAALPRPDIVFPEMIIGKNTISAMRSGITFGYISLIEGMLERIQQEFGKKMKVIATGGLASFLAQKTDAFDIINPDLTLIGLKILYQLNREDL